MAVGSSGRVYDEEDLFYAVHTTRPSYRAEMTAMIWDKSMCYYRTDDDLADGMNAGGWSAWATGHGGR